jgi:hypothetical protein
MGGRSITIRRRGKGSSSAVFQEGNNAWSKYHEHHISGASFFKLLSVEPIAKLSPDIVIEA